MLCQVLSAPPEALWKGMLPWDFQIKIQREVIRTRA